MVPLTRGLSVLPSCLEQGPCVWGHCCASAAASVGKPLWDFQSVERMAVPPRPDLVWRWVSGGCCMGKGLNSVPRQWDTRP